MSGQSIFDKVKGKFVISILLIGGIWLGLIFYLGLKKQNQLKEEQFILERKKSDLISRNLEIEEQLRRLQDEAYLEKEARKKFNYQREGEQLVIFVEPSTSSTASLAAIEDGVFTKLKNWIKLLFD
ncbi:hypothetical protein C4553_00950 [Candidatus Parcubacteria bacterium]|nr:MAG: hypothetical protein C4553_00950 [Candidatus Parcubacteria bacterium]